MSKRKALYILTGSIFAILAFIIHFFTPLHSDDFFYEMRGLSLEKQWEHYLGWSGRLVANFITPLILVIKNKVLIAVVQSLGLIALLHYLSQLPEMISYKQSKYPNPVAFILVSSLFWLFHPALGHATFWIAGSANYLWTNLIVCIYLAALLNYYYKDKFSYVLFFLALIAGCSNENTAPIIVGFTFLLLLSKTFTDKRIDIKLGITFILNAIGGALLILSPGNQARLNRLEEWYGVKWRDLSLMEKISKFDSNYWEFLKYPVLLLVIFYLIIYLFQPVEFFRKDKKISFIAISFIFALGSLASDFMMLLSPQYPPRSMSGGFIFLLIAISFALHHIIQLTGKKTRVKYLYYACTFFFLFLFGKEYLTNILPLYHSAFQQSKVQLAMVEKFKKENLKDVKIPRIHFDSDYPDRIIFDRYEEPTAYAEYYGLDKVEFYSFDFDISKLGKSNSLVENKNLMTEKGLKNLYMYSTHKRTHFAIELSKAEVDSLKENYNMFFHVFDNKNNLNNFDIGTIEPILYNGKYFIINHVNFRTKNIKKINFGYFDVSDWKIRYAEQIVELRK